MAHQLDELDLKLLAQLQEDCSQTIERLGERIGASRSSVQRRIGRLRRDGVILAETAHLSAQALGRPMSFVISITLERETAETTAGFMQKMEAAAAVQQCYYTTGEADFIVIITARDMADYNAIVDQLFVDDPRVRRFHTNVVIKPVKAKLNVPICGLDDQKTKAGLDRGRP
jgi:Lrp/AsnC family leucine-responsive transcriptional regulator